jgi:hypothetical protein
LAGWACAAADAAIVTAMNGHRNLRTALPLVAMRAEFARRKYRPEPER